MIKSLLTLVIMAVAIAVLPTPGYGEEVPAIRAELKTKNLTAKFYNGLLLKLKNNLTGRVLISNNPKNMRMPSNILGGIANSGWKISLVKKSSSELVYKAVSANGKSTVIITWKAESKTGDIALNIDAESSSGLIKSIKFPIPGINIKDYKAVLPVKWGLSHVQKAPMHGKLSCKFPGMMAVSFFLFEGNAGSWAMAFNDKDYTPKRVNLVGKGQNATLEIVRNSVTTKGQSCMRMFPVKFQACRGPWQQLADRYALEWLEKGLGMTPLSKRPEWVRNIRVSIMARPEIIDLEKLAEELDPSQTLLYVCNWRNHGFDYGYPDYIPSDKFKQWCKKAKKLGFRICVHYNMNGVNKGVNDAFKRFKLGMNPVYPGWGVQDPDTGFQMWSVDKGKSGHYLLLRTG